MASDRIFWRERALALMLFSRQEFDLMVEHYRGATQWKPNLPFPKAAVAMWKRIGCEGIDHTHIWELRDACFAVMEEKDHEGSTGEAGPDAANE